MWNYVVGNRLSIAPKYLPVIGRLAAGTSLTDLKQEFVGSIEGWELVYLVSVLDKSGMLNACTEARSARLRLPWGWQDWSPEAALFHFSTRNTPYALSDEAQIEVLMERRQRATIARRVFDGAEIRLPRPRNLNDCCLRRALLQRQTCRTFNGDVVALADVADVLFYTWGKTASLESSKFGVLARRTSPSAGALHPIDAYLLARNVEGLEPRGYYFDFERNSLFPVADELSEETLGQVAPWQREVLRGSAAVFVMAATFARSQWKYPFARAYRTILLDAGHLGQTFCLVTTALGLGAFVSAAFSEDVVEGYLGLDGESEGAMYLCALGQRL